MLAEEVANPEKGTGNPSAVDETLAAAESETLRDEFCTDESYEISEELVEKILVTADCQAGMTE